jgi:hypothetical protein
MYAATLFVFCNVHCVYGYDFPEDFLNTDSGEKRKEDANYPAHVIRICILAGGIFVKMSKIVLYRYCILHYTRLKSSAENNAFTLKPTTSEGTRLRGERDKISFYTVLFLLGNILKLLAAIGQHFQESEKNLGKKYRGLTFQTMYLSACWHVCVRVCLSVCLSFLSFCLSVC